MFIFPASNKADIALILDVISSVLKELIALKTNKQTKNHETFQKRAIKLNKINGISPCFF